MPAETQITYGTGGEAAAQTLAAQVAGAKLVPNAKLPAGTVETLVKPENKGTLTKILTYHVVPGNYSAADLMALAKKSGGQAELKTAEGSTLAVIVKGNRVFVADNKGNTSRVTIANVKQSNGVIHVIDKVQMP